MKQENEKSQTPQPTKAEYQKPELKRWGPLRDLTQGGGGTRNEPSKAKTRF